MKRSIKIIVATLLSLFVLFVLVVSAPFIFRWGYYREMNEIKSTLNSIEGIEVVNIWGHEDLTLEEVSARIKVNGKGEIVVGDLNENDSGFPSWIHVDEINGFSFETFSCTCWTGGKGVGGSINIGTDGELGPILKRKYSTVDKVLLDYDRISFVVDSLFQSQGDSLIYLPPNPSDEFTSATETFIRINKLPAKDQDPIFVLLGVEDKFAFAEKLSWRTDKCRDTVHRGTPNP